MKRLLSIFLCTVLAFGICVLPAHATRENPERYEEKFQKVAATYTYMWGEDDFYYYYHELGDYYSVLTDRDDPDAQPDWVLVKAWGPAQEPWFTYTLIGDRILFGEGSLPFSHDYGVYDVRRGTFSSLEGAWNSGAFPELHETVERLHIGYPIGDADMDHELTVLDATRIQRIIAALSQPEEKDEIFGYAYSTELSYVSDYDRDGERSVMDATGIQRRMADLEEVKPEYVHTTGALLGVRAFEGEPVDFELLEYRDNILDKKMSSEYAGAVIQSKAELSDFLGQSLDGYGDEFFADNALYVVRVKLSGGYESDFALADLTAKGEYLYPHFTATGYDYTKYGYTSYSDRLLLYRIDQSTAQSAKALIASAEATSPYLVQSVGVTKNAIRLSGEVMDMQPIEEGQLSSFNPQKIKASDFNFAVLNQYIDFRDFLGIPSYKYNDEYFKDHKLLVMVYKDSPVESIYSLHEIYGDYRISNEPNNTIETLYWRYDVKGELPENYIWKYAFYELTEEEAENLKTFRVQNTVGGTSENIFWASKDKFNNYYDMKYPTRILTEKDAYFYETEDKAPYYTIFYTYDEYVNSKVVSEPDPQYDEAFFKKRALLYMYLPCTCKKGTAPQVTVGSEAQLSVAPEIFFKLTMQSGEENVKNGYDFLVSVPKPSRAERYTKLNLTTVYVSS